MSQHAIDPALFSRAITAHRNGDSSLMGDLYAQMEPWMSHAAKYQWTYRDPSDARGVMDEAFLNVPDALDVSNPGAIGYFLHHLSLSLRASVADLTHFMSSPTSRKRYRRLKAAHTRPDDQASEWVDRAYEALKAGEAAENAVMAPATFLALHTAIEADQDTVPVHLYREAEEAFSVPDEMSELETRILVHEHLLPLLRETRETYAIYLRFGFTDLLPPEVHDMVVAHGLYGELDTNGLSSREIAAVLGTNGLGMRGAGYKTIQRGINDALARMRLYLAEDDVRECGEEADSAT